MSHSRQLDTDTWHKNGFVKKTVCKSDRVTEGNKNESSTYHQYASRSLCKSLIKVHIVLECCYRLLSNIPQICHHLKVVVKVRC